MSTEDTGNGSFLAALAARPISRENALPLYYQAAMSIQAAISEAHPKPGVPLPAESELAAVLGVSRPTLRQALSRLNREGVVHSQRGVGTFALPPSLPRSGGVPSLFRDLQAQGLSPHSEVLELREAVAPPEVEAVLGTEGRPVWYVRRIRFAEDRPFALSENYLSLPSGTLRRAELETSSLYEVLHRDFGVELVKASQGMSARGATKSEAAHLDVEVGSSVLVVRRRTYDPHGRAVELSETIFPEGIEIQTTSMHV